MSTSALFLGSASAATLYQTDQGTDDAGTVFQAELLSNPILPGGPHDEAAYHLVSLMVTHYEEAAEDDEDAETVEIVVTAVVDEEDVYSTILPIRQQTVTDALNPPRRVRRIYDLMLRVPYLVDEVEQGRYAPRGAVFQLRVEWPGSALTINGGHVEAEPTRTPRQASNT